MGEKNYSHHSLYNVLELSLHFVHQSTQLNMEKKLSSFLLLLLLFQTTISVESHDPSPALLKYVLQWPPTFCINLHSKKEDRCKVPIPEDLFTLHGLMQADEGGFNIKCENHHTHPNWNDLFPPIEPILVTFWPSLREDFSQRYFWKHEWYAHGSCGGTTPKEYFQKAIEINYLPQHGNLFNYFEASGIIPSDEKVYTKERIVEAIQKLFDEPHVLPPPPSPSPSRRLNVYLSCIPIDPEDHIHYYLSEVTLCTNLDGDEYISCPSEAEPTSCPDYALIKLPHPKYPELDLPQNIWKKPMEHISDV